MKLARPSTFTSPSTFIIGVPGFRVPGFKIPRGQSSAGPKFRGLMYRVQSSTIKIPGIKIPVTPQKYRRYPFTSFSEIQVSTENLWFSASGGPPEPSSEIRTPIRWRGRGDPRSPPIPKAEGFGANQVYRWLDKMK